MTTPESTSEELTPLSDPNNVKFTVVDPELEGFTDDEITRLLNGEPLNVVTAAANDDKLVGAMIALVPSGADLERLALADYEPADELHLTLWYLGKDDFAPEVRDNVVEAVARATSSWESIEANAFGAAHWNPDSDEPAWVLNVGDASDEIIEDGRSNIAMIRADIASRISDFHMPEQHTPWQPHICVAYSDDDLLDVVSARVGPVTFDYVRIAFGQDVIDIALGANAFVAAGGKPKNHNQLKEYWTKDPEGLAKWADHPHPWTALYNHLRKHMPSEMAKRVASQWYHDVKGHWPSEKHGKK